MTDDNEIRLARPLTRTEVELLRLAWQRVNTGPTDEQIIMVESDKADE